MLIAMSLISTPVAANEWHGGHADSDTDHIAPSRSPVWDRCSPQVEAQSCSHTRVNSWTTSVSFSSLFALRVNSLWLTNANGGQEVIFYLSSSLTNCHYADVSHCCFNRSNQETNRSFYWEPKIVIRKGGIMLKGEKCKKVIEKCGRGSRMPSNLPPLGFGFCSL